MRLAYEALPLSDDAPTPDQLFVLASRGVLLAKRCDKFRAMPHSVANRSHSMLPTSRVVVPDLMEAPFGYRYEERIAARIARPGPRRWSMRLLSTFMVTDMGSQRGCERHTYSFKWDTNQTTLANHELRVLPATDRDLYDEIDNFSVPDTIADEYHWRMQLAAVTSGDVELLTQDFEALLS